MGMFFSSWFVAQRNVLKTVARDQSLTLTDEHRMQLEFTSVQEVSGVLLGWGLFGIMHGSGLMLV